MTELRPLAYRDSAELTRLLRPGVDGVVLKHAFRQATFLPQVWERVPNVEDFLNLLCLKMDLPEDEWRKGRMEVHTYEAEKFSEREFARGEPHSTRAP